MDCLHQKSVRYFCGSSFRVLRLVGTAHWASSPQASECHHRKGAERRLVGGGSVGWWDLRDNIILLLWALHSQVQSAPRKGDHQVLGAKTRRWAWGQGREKHGPESGEPRGQGPLGPSPDLFSPGRHRTVLGAGRGNTDRSQKVGPVASNRRKELGLLGVG